MSRSEHDEAMVRALRTIALALYDDAASPGTDESGGRVGCVTEALMGVTAGLFAIASAIRERGEDR